MSSFDFGAEFPHYVEARENLLSTLNKLNLYTPETAWEDLIIDAYHKMQNQAHYVAPSILISPEILEELKKSHK